MKGFKLLLRIWIAIASVLGFLGGWSLLAHANKPAPLISSSNTAASSSQLAPLPTLAPLPSFNSSGASNNGLQSFQVQPQVQAPVQSFSRMRTSGS